MQPLSVRRERPVIVDGSLDCLGVDRRQPRRAVYCTGDPLPVAIAQALKVGVQVRDVLPQLVAMCGMSFQIVRSAVQVSMFALKVFTGADQLLMLVFEAVVHA